MSVFSVELTDEQDDARVATRVELERAAELGAAASKLVARRVVDVGDLDEAIGKVEKAREHMEWASKHLAHLRAELERTAGNLRAPK